MSSFTVNLKRFLFLSLGISVVAGIIFGASMVGFSSKTDYLSLKILISVGLSIAFVLLVFLIEMMYSNSFNTFLLGIVSLVMNRHNKLVYHYELGYFFTSFQDEKVIVYRQGIFYIKELVNIFNNGNPEYVAECIKQKLDEIYSVKVKKERERKEISDRINNLKKWDGYLDKRGRRDGKINDILN